MLQTLWQYAAPRVGVSLDGEVIVLPLLMLAVGNCAAYAGGMRIAPTARPDDGAFDVCLVQLRSQQEDESKRAQHGCLDPQEWRQRVPAARARRPQAGQWHDEQG
jgi:hypothetical protein